MAPWGVKLPKSWENYVPKDSLKTFKYFLKTFFSFEFSFFELISTTVNSKASLFKIEVEIGALIRRYGYFSAYIAMSACTFSKPSQIGNFDAIKAFLKANEEKLQNQEKNFVACLDQLYFQLLELHQNSDLTRLEIFRENFKANASVLLAKMELESSSSEIFLYSSFQEDAIETFSTCAFSMERFSKEMIGRLNLYFKAKLLGIKGLNFVQSH